MKTYYLTLSQTFPAKHPRHGQLTQFVDKFQNARYDATNVNSHYDVGMPNVGIKLHTIRANYPFWAKRFEKINAGEAVLSVRQWSGKPYRSKMIEIARLTKEDGIGIQRLEVTSNCFGINNWQHFDIDGRGYMSINAIPNNDGLSREDWINWFKSYDISKPLAIIHFTNFRYGRE